MTQTLDINHNVSLPLMLPAWHVNVNFYGFTFLWSQKLVLTRKMSRVVVISTPLTASVCQELLEFGVKGLFRGPWVCVPLMSAIGATAETKTFTPCRKCICCMDDYHWKSNLRLCIVTYECGLRLVNILMSTWYTNRTPQTSFLTFEFPCSEVLCLNNNMCTSFVQENASGAARLILLRLSGCLTYTQII